MMHRTQLNLDPESHRQARRRAAEMGISLAEYVRRLVRRDLERREPTADPSRVFALGRSRGSDVAQRKDTMLGEAVAQATRRASRRRRA
jgi:hypothetical protein